MHISLNQLYDAEIMFIIATQVFIVIDLIGM